MIKSENNISYYTKISQLFKFLTIFEIFYLLYSFDYISIFI